MAMPTPAIELAAHYGVSAERASAHTSRLLDEVDMQSADLVIAMATTHRRAVVELYPPLLRRTFTLLEFSRLATSLSDSQILAAMAAAVPGDGPSRLLASLSLIAGQRGYLPPSADPLNDDVVDPIGKPEEVYARSGIQISSAMAELERVLRHAVA